ncbi:hypothetical protein D3C74_175170 [compost metagenome]
MTDPYFQVVPWDIITDESGRVIGEVYVTLPEPPQRRIQSEWDTTSTLLRKNTQKLKK